MKAQEQRYVSRRRNPRAQVSVPASFTVVGAGTQLINGKIVDFSSLGVGILLDTRMTPGAVVLVHSKSGLFAGTVRHCRRDGNGYRAGLLLEDVPASRNAVAALRHARAISLSVAS